ncbi:hypothetical protein RR45_GL001630 [Lactococcus chungangensis CAU 28 = DSM 22330]|uniref:DUF4372 domain-containing protein n=1 Tax=Pseudolactococcus chungangensis CAU 28 = DSM 22330 TaxID=1122154 RepID=A0ABX4I455_9LACT|nr:hypothetical protein RR45_GL001630 [Lactococcus chungangensis CAU 28 = DSM 22330]
MFSVFSKQLLKTFIDDSVTNRFISVSRDTQKSEQRRFFGV